MADEIAAEVIIVDDDPSVQRALKRLLTVHRLPARVYGSAQEFLDQGCPAAGCGCLLLDIEMPGINGLELQAQLRRRGFRLPIVFITGHGTVPMSVEAMKQGAMDFVQKPFDSPSLIEIIRKAIARSRQHAIEQQECLDLEQRLESLSQREREVFRFVIAGFLNKQIAFELGIAEKTVKVHRARVMEKMQANSLAELVQLAEKLRLPPCSSSIFPSVK
jgi:RNA polymerase sigma factor (sigma-70 family)